MVLLIKTSQIMNFTEALNKAVEIYGKAVETLIDATNNVGVTFCSIRNYQSDKSDNSENANHIVNVGVRYENMIEKDVNIFANFNIETVNVDAFNYETIDTGKLSLEQYKAAVKEALPIALTELQQPKKERQSNDVWFNKVVVFNLTTQRLSIVGQSVTKTVTEKGEFKVVKSAPKTIAKRLIEKQAKGRTAAIRRFTIENLETVNVMGDTIEI